MQPPQKAGRQQHDKVRPPRRRGDVALFRLLLRGGELPDPIGDQHYQPGIQGVQQRIGQMITGRIESPEAIVNGKGYPGQRHPPPHVGGAEGLGYKLPVQNPDGRIVIDVERIVEIDEIKGERAQIERQTDHDDQNGR